MYINYQHAGKRLFKNMQPYYLIKKVKKKFTDDGMDGL
jgi:hypothetical protein